MRLPRLLLYSSLIAFFIASANAAPITSLYILTSSTGYGFIARTPDWAAPGTVLDASALASCTTYASDLVCTSLEFQSGGRLGLSVASTFDASSLTAFFQFPGEAFYTPGVYDIGPPFSYLAVLKAPAYPVTSYLYDILFSNGDRLLYLHPGPVPAGTRVGAADLPLCSTHPIRECYEVEFQAQGVIAFSFLNPFLGTSSPDFPDDAFSTPGVYSAFGGGATLNVMPIPAAQVPEPGSAALVSSAGLLMLAGGLFRRIRPGRS